MNPTQLKNPLYDSEWLTSEDAEGEGRELVATDCRIILVTDDVTVSGNERHQTLVRKMRERFRVGKHVTLQCDEGSVSNGGWAKSVRAKFKQKNVGKVSRPLHRDEVVFGHVADGPLPEKGEIHSHCGKFVGWQKWKHRAGVRWLTVS